MTIPLCHVSTMSAWGGVERLLLDFLLACSVDSDQDTFQHALLASSTLPEIQQLIKEAAVPFFQPVRRFRYDPKGIVEVAKWLRRKQIPIVHTYNGRANAWGYMACWLAQTPIYVGGEHGSSWSLRPPLSWFNRWAYGRAEVIVANSVASKIMIQRRYGTSPTKIRVVYNFVPPLPRADPIKIRSELGVSTFDILIGSVGRVVPEKNFKVFVDVARELVKMRKNIKFVLVGGGSQLEYLKNYIRETGLSDRFILTGDRTDARELLQAFDLFVSTSIRESFGNVLIEAALAGIPTVAPCIDGVQEAVIDNVTGKLLEPTQEITQLPGSPPFKLPRQMIVGNHFSRPLALNAIHLMDAILELIDNPDLREQYSEAAKRRAQEVFSFSRYRNELESVYLSCLTS